VNDAFGAAYALAAVDLGLRSRENKSTGDVWLALLSAALVSGVKQTDILLVIPGLIAVLPSARLLLARPLSSLAILATCALVSALPIMIFNLHFMGNWAGTSPNSWTGVELQSPVWGVIGNAFWLTLINFKPPFFPFVNAWNEARAHFLQTPFGAHFRQFEDFGRLTLGVSEYFAGLGAGVCFLIVISWLAARRYRRRPGAAGITTGPAWQFGLLRWTPWALLLLFMAKVGSFANGRYLAPYYILLFPSLLTSPGQPVLVRRRWWRGCAVLVMGSAALLLVISRDRPLFPASAFGWLETKFPDSKLAMRIAQTYSETAAFEQQRQFLRTLLPPDAKILGYTADTGIIESFLWLPYGQRKVRRIFPDETAEQLLAAGIRYVVVENDYLKTTKQTIEQWQARYHGELVRQWGFLEDPYSPPQPFYLIRLSGV
jgi:hypothetical protein